MNLILLSDYHGFPMLCREPRRFTEMIQRTLHTLIGRHLVELGGQAVLLPAHVPPRKVLLRIWMPLLGCRCEQRYRCFLIFRYSLAALDGLRNPVLLPNPLPQRSELGVVRAEVSPEGFIAVARLVHQKGLDVLIDALAIAGGVAQGWTLTVVGEGPEREALMAQVTRLQLGDRVRFSDTVPM